MWNKKESHLARYECVCFQCIRKWFREQSTCPTCRNYALLHDEFPTLHSASHAYRWSCTLSPCWWLLQIASFVVVCYSARWNALLLTCVFVWVIVTVLVCNQVQVCLVHYQFAGSSGVFREVYVWTVCTDMAINPCFVALGLWCDPDKLVTELRICSHKFV